MKIAVFAGHGGSDYGAVVNGLYEKNLNLALSNAISENLRRMGYEVINNRVTDVDRNINRDAALANDRRADALVEIHMNSNAGTPGTGSEAFVSVRDTGKARTAAETILSSLERLGFRNRGVKTGVNAAGQDSFGILRLTNMPAVLLELAFIDSPASNPDVGILRNRHREMAAAIAKGIYKHFNMAPGAAGPPAATAPAATSTVSSATTVKFNLPGGKSADIRGRIIDNITHVQARHLLETMGYIVDWDVATGSVVVRKPD